MKKLISILVVLKDVSLTVFTFAIIFLALAIGLVGIGLLLKILVNLFSIGWGLA